MRLAPAARLSELVEFEAMLLPLRREREVRAEAVVTPLANAALGRGVHVRHAHSRAAAALGFEADARPARQIVRLARSRQLDRHARPAPARKAPPGSTWSLHCPCRSARRAGASRESRPRRLRNPRTIRAHRRWPEVPKS